MRIAAVRASSAVENCSHFVGRLTPSRSPEIPLA